MPPSPITTVVAWRISDRENRIVYNRSAPVPHRLTESRYARGQTGLQDKDPTIAELLKPHGYATAQIGKNHLGDRNEYLPTVHGFDEFYNLYHLNAEEEPEDAIPEGSGSAEWQDVLRAIRSARGVLHCKASDRNGPTEDPRFGRVGKQTIEDTGPLTRERMRTVEKDLLDPAGGPSARSRDVRPCRSALSLILPTRATTHGAEAKVSSSPSGHDTKMH